VGVEGLRDRQCGAEDGSSRLLDQNDVTSRHPLTSDGTAPFTGDGHDGHGSGEVNSGRKGRGSGIVRG
jgi:hypothetical protein